MLLEKQAEKDLCFTGVVSDAILATPKLGMEMVKVATGLHSLRKTNRVKQAELLDYYETKESSYKAGTANWLMPSKMILQDEDAPAAVLLVVLKNILGPAVMIWEPESIWMELEDREHLNIPAINRDKLLAAMTLLEVPAFYWEVNTFQNTVMAFNNTAPNIDIIQEATPAYIAWAVYEADLVLQENQDWEPEFDYEPVLYTAESLHRAGFVLAPKILEFAQEALDKRNGDGALVTKAQVQDAWNDIKDSSLLDREFTETPLDVQLAKLAYVQVYTNERVEQYQQYLKQLA